MIKTKLTLEDAQSIINLGEELKNESRFREHTYNPVGVEQILAATVKAPDKFFIAYDDQFRGLILMGIREHYFSTYKQAGDFAFFVKAEHRGSTLAVRLLQEAEKWAKEQGAHDMTILHNTGINMDQASRFFNRIGYGTQGQIFSKEL